MLSCLEIMNTHTVTVGPKLFEDCDNTPSNVSSGRFIDYLVDEGK